MESDGAKRGRGNSIAAGHPGAPASNDNGSMAKQQVGEARTQESSDMNPRGDGIRARRADSNSPDSMAETSGMKHPAPSTPSHEADMNIQSDQYGIEANKVGKGKSQGTATGQPTASRNDCRSTGPRRSLEIRFNGLVDVNQDRGVQITRNRSKSADPPRKRPSSLPNLPSIAARPAPFTKQQPSGVDPPVTKQTLSELDVNKIMNNPKLRHDINFDPDLHFRPNLDGEKGVRKTQKANNFWDMMKSQLRQFLMHREEFEKKIGHSEWCLPATLKAIRGILETLIPHRDHPAIRETFNVDLLMQQFRMGVADLVKLSEWLSQLLKCHCAPMRDSWVDEMVVQMSNGDRNGDVDSLVQGMQNLLGVLESMKLDVANHQIRCLRPVLIADTVQYEQKFFMKKIAMGNMDIAQAHAWYKQASSIPEIARSDGSTRSQSNTWDFMKGLVHLVLPEFPLRPANFPHSFLFDEERLVRLRLDMLDQMNLEVCMRLYRDLMAQSRSQDWLSVPSDDTPESSQASYVSSPNRSGSPADDIMLSSPTIPMPHHFERGYFVRQPSGRQVWVPRVNEGRATSASPMSSPSSTASTPYDCPATPLYLALPFTDSSIQVRDSLLAILAGSKQHEKWTSQASTAPLALQILRSTTTSLTRLPQFEEHLNFHLSNSKSSVYQQAEKAVLSQLFPILQKTIDTYEPLTTLQIFEMDVLPRSASWNFRPETGVKGEITDIATRLAHVGILHWRVWAPLAYLVDPDADEDISEDTRGERAQNMLISS